MNQNLNNLNQNNNYNFDPMTGQPVSGQPVQNTANMYEQPMTQPISSMPPSSPKKNNLGLIIGLVAIIAAVVGGIFIFGDKSESTDGKNPGNKKEQNKTVTYFNKATVNTTDKIFFNLEYDYAPEKGLFFGISDKGVANNLKVDDSSDFSNDVITISQYDKGDELSIYYNDNYFGFELELDRYSKDENGEYIDNNLVVYKEGNYILTENNIDSYTLYYLYDEDYYDSDKTSGMWYTVLISFPDTIELGKERIQEIDSSIDICVYNKNEGFENCLTADGKKIDYKKYKYINDILITTLVDYNLYLDSYECIKAIDYEDIIVNKYIAFEGTSEDNLTEFEIDLDSWTPDAEDVITTSTLNGVEVQYEKPYSLHYANIKNETGYTEILINLPYNVDETDENAIKALTDTFSKTK